MNDRMVADLVLELKVARNQVDHYQGLCVQAAELLRWAKPNAEPNTSYNEGWYMKRDEWLRDMEGK